MISCLKICRANAIPFLSLNIGIFKSGCLPWFRSSLVMSSCLAILYVCEPGSTCEVQKNRFPLSRTTSKVMNIYTSITYVWPTPHLITSTAVLAGPMVQRKSSVTSTSSGVPEICGAGLAWSMDDFFSFKVMGVQFYRGKFVDPSQKRRKSACNSCIYFLCIEISYEIHGA